MKLKIQGKNLGLVDRVSRFFFGKNITFDLKHVTFGKNI